MKIILISSAVLLTEVFVALLTLRFDGWRKVIGVILIDAVCLTMAGVWSLGIFLDCLSECRTKSLTNMILISSFIFIFLAIGTFVSTRAFFKVSLKHSFYITGLLLLPLLFLLLLFVFDGY